jgi:hypothetical protein
MVTAPRLALAFLAADGVVVPAAWRIDLLAVSSIATAVVLTGGTAYLAHAIAAASSGRGLLVALWTAAPTWTPHDRQRHYTWGSWRGRSVRRRLLSVLRVSRRRDLPIGCRPDHKPSSGDRRKGALRAFPETRPSAGHPAEKSGVRAHGFQAAGGSVAGASARNRPRTVSGRSCSNWRPSSQRSPRLGREGRMHCLAILPSSL